MAKVLREPVLLNGWFTWPSADMATPGSDLPGAVPACGHPKSRRILKAPVSHSFGWNVGCSSVLALVQRQARQGCTESRLTGRHRGYVNAAECSSNSDTRRNF